MSPATGRSLRQISFSIKLEIFTVSPRPAAAPPVTALTGFLAVAPCSKSRQTRMAPGLKPCCTAFREEATAFNRGTSFSTRREYIWHDLGRRGRNVLRRLRHGLQ